MTTEPPAVVIRPRDRRFAELGAVLAKAVANDELDANYALRILRHQLRVMNVNSAIKASVRSEGAQAVIDRYTESGAPIPKNGSGDALHCDHVNALTASDLARLLSSEAWLDELARLQAVACVTAAENYRLEQIERQGASGWEKYPQAGIRLVPPSE